MPIPSAAFVQERLCLDFAALKHACPRGVYVAPDPDRSLQWMGVLFVKKGPYSNAVLRFRMMFSTDYPRRPPSITFLTDVFHPLVNPLTTYTYSTRNFGSETMSTADEQRLPPGGLSLRHMFPEWYQGSIEQSPNTTSLEDRNSFDPLLEKGSANYGTGSAERNLNVPHVIEILQYLRVAFDTEAILDSIPLEAAANSGAWHAWRSYRSRTLGTGATSPVSRTSNESNEANNERTGSSRQQPGGAKRPGEWDWQGVWEDRVRRSIQVSTSDPVLFGGDGSDVVNFLRMDPDVLSQLLPSRTE